MRPVIWAKGNTEHVARIFGDDWLGVQPDGTAHIRRAGDHSGFFGPFVLRLGDVIDTPPGGGIRWRAFRGGVDNPRHPLHVPVRAPVLNTPARQRWAMV